MRNYFLPATLLFIQFCAFSQSITNQPFILRGQIKNTQEHFFLFKYYDENYKEQTDTITISPTGQFYREIRLKYPQRVAINQNNIVITDLFIAPSYNLEITGNAINADSFIKTKSIKGVGSNSNLYRPLLDSIINARNAKADIYTLAKEEYLQYLNKSLLLSDSLANEIFNPKRNSDLFAADLKKLVLFENSITRLYFLTYYVFNNKLIAAEARTFIQSNIPGSVLENLYNENNMISTMYRRTMRGNYLSYLAGLQDPADTTVSKIDLELQIVKNEYKGPIKDFVLFYLLNSKIENAVSFESMANIAVSLESYSQYFEDPSYVDQLGKNFAKTRIALNKTQIGKPAPLFNLESSAGKLYSLSDFLGKVVYLDLWASWCAPCRKEIPNLKSIYKKYKSNEDLVIIGLAIRDTHADWKKALQEEKPEWLQLIDSNDSTRKSYSASWIPRYILIDKNGNIASFDAPGPANQTELERLINEELVKVNPVPSTSKDTFLVNYLKRNIRYPLSGLKNNQQKTLYMSLKFRPDGHLEKYEIHDNLKPGVPHKEVVIVGQYNPENLIQFTDSANLNTGIFAKSLQSVLEKIKFPHENLISTKQYYIKVAFRIETIYDPVLKMGEPN